MPKSPSTPPKPGINQLRWVHGAPHREPDLWDHVHAAADANLNPTFSENYRRLVNWQELRKAKKLDW
jgi:hypothetical protein